MRASIAVLPGDGIGEEVMTEALRVLSAVAVTFGHEFVTKKGLVGGAAHDVHGTHLPDETIALCRGSDAVLFGSVGGPLSDAQLPKWKECEVRSILALRKAFSFQANLRPIVLHPTLSHLSPLREEIVHKGVDLLIVRELNGDIYFGEHRTFREGELRVATDVARYDEAQIASVAHVAFRAAVGRRRVVCSVHKANVLDTSKLWREVVREVSREYPEVTLEEMLVDNCAMQIVKNPSQFDVIVTSNMFGDILSDAAAVLPGSLGLTPSASLNGEGFGLYEPSGGSAPDIAGKGIANPLAQILSLSMMLRYSFGLNPEADAVDRAAREVLEAGARTGDLCRPGEPSLTTTRFTDEFLSRLRL